MIPRKQKKYWEMSALEKQIKFKDLTPFECYKLHHEEMQKFTQEQIEKQRALERKKREEQEKKKLEKQQEKELYEAAEKAARDTIVKEFEKLFKDFK